MEKFTCTVLRGGEDGNILPLTRPFNRGQHYGTSDARAEFPDRNPVAPEDITKTVYYAMGVTDLEARDAQGRPYNLLAEGAPITELF